MGKISTPKVHDHAYRESCFIGDKKSGPELHVDKKCHVGRTYADFLVFIEKHPDIPVREMDTVEGRKGGKVILTIFFRECDLQLMFLRESKTAAGVSAAFASMRKALGDDFTSIFKLILADRGTEIYRSSCSRIQSVQWKS